MSIDLTMPQMKTLLYAVGNPGATGGQLARAIGVSLSTMTGIVDRLVDQGIVTRREDRTDRRLIRVDVTDAGRQMVERLYAASLDWHRRLLVRMDADALASYHRSMSDLLRAATEEAEEQSARTLTQTPVPNGTEGVTS
jgi:DNA-binding MarR family transcriptional regulator